MSVYSIWESRFPAETAEEGIQVTQAIWHDMLCFDGYLAHELIQDLDQPGHLFVISRWASREAADAAMSYTSHPNAKACGATCQRASSSHGRRPTVIDAALIVALANAQADRRPTHARTAVRHDALADAASASELLKPFLGDSLDAQELVAVRALKRAVIPIVDALIDGSRPPLKALNALAARKPAIHALERRPDGKLHPTLRPKRASAAAALLVAAIRELSELEPSRLRRCARPECRLVFYDVTRSATQRWHAERPCGLRERQRRHRAK